MGGGDLNLKKSWHPLLIKNQERVWKEEKRAVDERKRTQQLLKEQAEERQIQELQRLGGKRDERVDWIYNAPAAGSGQNAEELEAYLLGKKSVEQLFREQDRKKMELLKQASAPSGGSASIAPADANFQALGGSANSVRDMAAKVREDPLLAIKRQEQKAYEELMKDPKRLKELRAARGMGEGKTKHKRDETEEERAERKRRKKEAKRAGRMERSPSPYSRRDRSPYRRAASPRRDRSPYGRDRSPYGRDASPRRNSYRNERDRSPYDGRREQPPSRREREFSDYRSRRDSPPHEDHYKRNSRSNGQGSRDNYPPREGRYNSSAAPTSKDIPDAAARLAAMTASAAQVTADRDQRLAESDRLEKINAEREEAERQSRKVKGGGRLDPSFLKDQQAQMLQAKLEDSSLRKGNYKNHED